MADKPTMTDFVSALEGHEDGKLRAVDPAKLKALAKLLAKASPKILAGLAILGVPIPAGGAEVAKLVVDLLQGRGLLDAASA